MTDHRRYSSWISLLLFGLILAATLPSSALADSCSSLMSCQSCSNTSTCHWCSSDNKCHTIGSPYGCLYGVNCYNNQACVRKQPQPMPHKGPPMSVLVGLFVFLLSALLCTGACYWVVNEYIDHSTIVKMEKDSAYQELVTFEQKHEQGGELGGGASFDYRLMRAESGDGAWDPIPRVRVVERSRFITILSWLARIGVGLMIAWLILAVIGVILYAPHMPDINVCNTELDWNSIISGFSKLKLEADYQLLLSVYNPNRLDVAITSGQGVFKHDHTPIGAVEFPQFTIKGGAITDVLVTLVFTPSVWKSLQLDLEFQSGSLMIMVDMNVAGKVIWNNLPVYPFSYGMNNYFIHVGTAGSRDLCQCPGW